MMIASLLCEIQALTFSQTVINYFCSRKQGAKIINISSQNFAQNYVINRFLGYKMICVYIKVTGKWKPILFADDVNLFTESKN